MHRTLDHLDAADVAALAQHTGTTPFFAVDGAAVEKRVRQLRALLPERTLICFAIKANPLPALLERLRPRVDGADISSGGELQRALDAGFDGAQLGFTGPGKTNDELAAAVRAGVRICAESIGEIGRIGDAAAQQGRPARVALRINPDFHVAGTRVRMNEDSVFGIDDAQIPAALSLLRARELEFGGFHFHCASRMLNADVVRALHGFCTELAIRAADHAGLSLDWLNLGGGFGIPAGPDETPLDIAAVAAHLHTLDAQLQAAHPGGRIAIEPGRYLVGEAGIYVCRIIERKTVRGRTWLVVDGGAQHHLHATLQPDREKPVNLPMRLMQSNPAPDTERVSIAGRLCVPFDIIARDIELPVARPGDLLVLYQSGAYGASASPVNFLGHPPAAEILIR
ncbi:MAG: alanine racemase [Methyloversatilis sp.]|jgi:diaminopimelate decarboxylase|nr:alanine racemase [Methyloversatilis sp.]MBP6194470.1 alanine racemase [Methyloversatilis sp.]MBP9116747.1 alanine racemase [Methyloversatilis sp.]